MLRLVNISLCLILTVCACKSIDSDQGNRSRRTNEFYTHSHDGNLSRIPMVDPYEVNAWYSEGPQSWGFDLPFGSINLRSQVNEIRSIGIKDSVFVIYTGNFHDPVQNKASCAWLVVDAARKKQYSYTTRRDYLQHLRTLNTDSIRLYDIDKLFDDFDKHGILPPEWPANDDEK